MDDLDFLGASFLAFLDPALKVLGLLALHSLSSSFCSFEGSCIHQSCSNEGEPQFSQSLAS